MANEYVEEIMDQEIENGDIEFYEDADAPEEEKDKGEEPKKPGKVKRFFKAAWKGTKKVLPFVGSFSLGVASKVAFDKFGHRKATADIPKIPMSQDTSEAVAEAVKSAVTEATNN